jgi:hypothetical protein
MSYLLHLLIYLDIYIIVALRGIAACSRLLIRAISPLGAMLMPLPVSSSGGDSYPQRYSGAELLWF